MALMGSSSLGGFAWRGRTFTQIMKLGSIEADTSAESLNAVQAAQQLVGQPQELLGQV